MTVTTIPIAFYEDEKDNVPVSIEVSWLELANTLTSATPAPCTIADCTGKKCPHKMGSGEIGAWSPVAISGSRANENVQAVTVLVLDGDGLSQPQLDAAAECVRGLAWVAHTTHRHRRGEIFIRLALQLSRPVLASEWAKFYPAAIAYLGLDGIFDPACKDLARLYFLPTHPHDAEFLSDVGEGAPVDVDLILGSEPSTAVVGEFVVAPDASPEEFEDRGKLVSMLTAYRQSRARGSDSDREKANLIGRLLTGKPLAAPGGNADPTPIEPPADLPKGRGYAILRAAAICTGYLPADVPDDAYLEIFQSSINAMCFGRLTDKKEMAEHLLEKIRIGRDHRKQFDAEAQARNTSAKAYQVAIAEERERDRQAKGVTESIEEDDQAWMPELQTSKKGEGLTGSGWNAYLILKNSRELRGAFRWNEVTLAVESYGIFEGVEPEVLDVKVSNYLTQKWGLTFQGTLTAWRQVLAIAYENRFDPIKDYLNGLVWDGTSRIDADGGWLVKYAGAVVVDEDYVKDVGRKWLVAAVARGINPGCKADNVMVLEGEQGKRKSSLLEVLGGKYYADMAIVIGDKDSKMLAARSWISEIPDLAALKKTSEINAIKAFFSTRADTFRPPFGKTVITSPRRNVFAGTTNEEQYLGDPTGNRRFMCVKCKSVDLAAVIRDRDQLWAEAVVMYKKHVNECEDKLECGCWWFTGEAAKRAAKIADERLHDSPFLEGIREWWSEMAPDKRPKQVATNFVAKEAMKYTQDKISHWTLIETGSALTKLGFNKTRVRQDGKCINMYIPSQELLDQPQSEIGKLNATKSFKLRSV